MQSIWNLLEPSKQCTGFMAFGRCLSLLRLPRQTAQAGWFEQQTFISTVLESGKPQTKVPVNSVPGKDSGLQTAVFSQCAYRTRKKRALVSSLFYKGTSSVRLKAPTS